MHPILVWLWLFQFQVVPTLWLLLWITSVTHDTNAMSVVVDSKHRTIPPPPPNTMVITKIPSISLPVWSLACSTKALSSLSIESDSTTTTTTTATAATNTTTATATATTKEPPPPLPTMSMNIVTFTTAVSVAAPKLYILSLYYHTLTKDAFIASGFGILQLLRPHQQHLVPILGQHSGYDNTMMNYYSKRIECERMGYPWVSTYVNCHQSNDDKQQQQQHEEDDSFTLDLLPNCATYLHVKIVHRFDSSGTSRTDTATGTSSTSTAATLPAGDHLVVLCEVVATFQWDETTQTIIPTSWTNDDNHKPPSLDATNVLYTGQLRQEGII